MSFQYYNYKFKSQTQSISLAMLESLFVDLVFAILMAPVDAFNAILCLFDTTEYPSMDSSDHLSDMVMKYNFFAVEGRRSNQLAPVYSWDKYTTALAQSWRRVLRIYNSAMSLIVTGFKWWMYAVCVVWMPPVVMVWWGGFTMETVMFGVLFSAMAPWIGGLSWPCGVVYVMVRTLPLFMRSLS